MKRIILSFLALCYVVGFVCSQGCPPAATSTTTVTFTPNSSTVLSGAFSVSATKQVYFSKGNLQFNPAYNSWRFAEHQYDIIGNAAGNNTSSGSRPSVNAWMDLFGWGTSGYDNTYVDPTATMFQPWQSSGAYTHYGPSTDILAAGDSWSDEDYANNYDWGVYNFVAGVEKGLRTLTLAEWIYLLSTRTYSTKNAKDLSGLATVFGIRGIILLPDTWDWSTTALDEAAKAAGFDWLSRREASKIAYANNVLENTDAGHALWDAMENAGAVFLPAAGYRDGTTLSYTNEFIVYWTSTVQSGDNAYRVNFFCGGDYDYADITTTYIGRHRGLAVRLVKDVPVAP